MNNIHCRSSVTVGAVPWVSRSRAGGLCGLTGRPKTGKKLIGKMLEVITKKDVISTVHRQWFRDRPTRKVLCRSA